jgi:hypothetical protein
MIDQINPTTGLANGVMRSFGVGAGQLPAITDNYGDFEHNRLLAFNASQFEANEPSEFLSNYAVRYQDPLAASLQSLLQMLAPDVQCGMSRTVEYAVYLLQDAFLSMDNTLDDLRAIGADFTTLRNTTKTMVFQKIPNRGLAVEVDEDEERLDPDWQQRKVAYLLGILARTALRRALALFIASATAVAKNWSTPGDPDMDLLNELENSLIRMTRLILGPTAATKRKINFRAQNTAGGFASAGLSDQELADYLALDQAVTARNKYTSGVGATSSIFASYALLFIASDTMQKDDPSNLKTFWAPCKNGQRYATYVRQVGDKRWRIAVEKYELTAVTAVAGAEILTIS